MQDAIELPTATASDIIEPAILYFGTPVVLMHATDVQSGVVSPVSKALLERGRTGRGKSLHVPMVAAMAPASR